MSGIPIPKGGYSVVDSIYSMQDLDQSIVIKSLSDRSITSLKDLEETVPAADQTQQLTSTVKNCSSLWKHTVRQLLELAHSRSKIH